ncbi:hypothetical protein ANCCEY_04183 [Ancylostoma ceylanicum]|uniref:DH domain-containing protein n=1 Tax=Ancylostoma ceylanicum TaxID=53326 RepID=A0A0D6MA07_9BILA|nr:hypothetical protein ANCCEY_04183 [Ancylostoma ceylanicum]
MRSKSVPNAAALANGVNAANGIAVSGDVVSSNAARSQFRAEIMRDFIRSEDAYVASVQRTHEELLLPIRAAAILTPEDYAVLSCYIEDIAALQKSTLYRLKEALSLEVPHQRIGGILIASAAELKRLLVAYCENHPKAVEVLNEKMDAVRSVLLARGKDVPSLIAGLSEPFRHLDKYPAVLQELERNMPEGHVDRGDVQRSCAVFKDMKALCEAVRKQKELQLELLYTGQVEGWASFEQRGRILYVSVAPVTCDGVCDDRCFALFSRMLIVLEITLDVNSYRLHRKIPTNGLRVRVMENRGGLIVDGSKKLCFRVVPPHRSVLATSTSKKNVKMRKEVNVGEQHDAQLLRIIEAYCSGAVRAVPAAADCRPPQLIVAEDEKILVEEVVGDEIVIQEKSLVDTVYALKDQVTGLRQELASVSRALDREQRARRRLEEIVRRGSMNASSPVSTPRPTVEMSVSQ